MHPRFFTEQTDLTGVLPLNEEDCHHIRAVLRLRPGGQVIVCNGQGREALCTLDASGNPVAGEVTDCPGELSSGVHIYPSLAKGERFEWLLQKAVELGVTDITPVLSARCIVALPNEKKLTRWGKILRGAAEQSGRGILPRLHTPADFSRAVHEAVGLRLFCYEEERERTLRQSLAGTDQKVISVLTGPEGGYTPEEASLCQTLGWETVTLGARILRCETAPLFVLTAINLLQQG